MPRRPVSKQPNKRLHQPRVKLLPRSRAQVIQHFRGRGGLSIRPGCGQRIVAVGDGDDAGQDGNGVAAETVGVAGAVDALVVAADGGEDGAVAYDGAEHALADERVLADDAVFLWRQPTLL